MKALSGRQPWWWAILHAGKRIENRVWNTSYRGPILLHAAKVCTAKEFVDACDWMIHAGVIQSIKDVPPFKQLARGGVVGQANIVDVIPPNGLDANSPRMKSVDARWHMPGQFGFILTDVKPLPFFACKGSLGLFELPYTHASP
jgi:hypothetical protein